MDSQQEQFDPFLEMETSSQIDKSEENSKISDLPENEAINEENVVTNKETVECITPPDHIMNTDNEESSVYKTQSEIISSNENINNSNAVNESNPSVHNTESLQEETSFSERQDGADVPYIDTDYSDVKVKVIDIPDDDDLFDFLNERQHFKEDELKKTELYKYLTEENRIHPQSEQVTPYNSGDEHGPNDSQYVISSNESSESGSSSDESEENREDPEPVSRVSNRKTKQIPLQDDEDSMSALRIRRNPERKPNIKIPCPQKTATTQPNTLTKTTLDRLEKSKEVTNQWLKDLCIPENLTFSQPLKMNIVDLNQYLTCGLCKGYLYEASTITECMHTFCKNCIVRHCMEVSLHCPVCSILIHPTDPFVNIRLDRIIQDIVYKILPKVADTEMRRIEQFYAEHPEVEPKEIQLPPQEPKELPKEPKVVEKPVIPCSLVSLLLEAEEAEEQYENQEVLEKKFVRVSGRATLESVCDFLKKKLSLEDNHTVDLFCCGDAMEEPKCTLQTIKQNFYGDQDELMLLQYRIRQT